MTPLPKWIERRAWRRELDDPKRVTDDEVGVEPPAQVAVEALGAIDVRNRDDDDLELHVDRPRFGGLDCRSITVSSWLMTVSCLSSSSARCCRLRSTSPGAHLPSTTSGFPFSTIYVASSAALPLPTFFAAWIVPAGMNRTSPALSVTGGLPSS